MMYYNNIPVSLSPLSLPSLSPLSPLSLPSPSSLSPFPSPSPYSPLPLPSLLSLTKNVEKRPHYSELLEHPLIKKYETETVDLGEWFKDMCRTHGNP